MNERYKGNQIISIALYGGFYEFFVSGSYEELNAEIKSRKDFFGSQYTILQSYKGVDLLEVQDIIINAVTRLNRAEKINLENLLED